MAVISVLLIVALIAGLATALMTRQNTVLHSVQNEQYRLRNYWLLRGEINHVQARLRHISHRQPVVRLGGDWSSSGQSRPITLDNGIPARLYTLITDEQSKYNLTNLVERGQIQPKEVSAFLRLCALLGVPPAQAELISQRVISSLIDDQAPDTAPPHKQTGTHSVVSSPSHPVQAKAPHHRAPRLRVLHDLTAVPGVQAATLARLQPYVTVLPERTWINANTASPVVIAAWVPGLSLEQAKALLKSRDQGTWFINHGDIIQRLNMPQLPSHEVLLGITSSWFHVQALVQSAQGISQIQALIHHDIRQQRTQLMWLREGV